MVRPSSFWVSRTIREGFQHEFKLVLETRGTLLLMSKGPWSTPYKGIIQRLYRVLIKGLLGCI